MKRLTAGLFGLTLALTAASGALAADGKPAPATVDSKIGDLLANPVTKAVLDKDIPGLETSPYLDMVKGMSVRDIAKYPQANIDDAKLSAALANGELAIKTASATMRVLPGGVNVNNAHKIPFNYHWDIVVVNGPLTLVAP